jgi:hypothetical protein
LTIGLQTIIGEDLPDDFRHADATELLRARGIADVTSIDLFDETADLQYDLNVPVPSREEERYRTVCDIGSLEHVFDTKQCMENCMRMVGPGGHYLLQTPVKGYYGHGFHTFNPELIISAFRLNGFDIEYLKYSTGNGMPIEELEHVPAGLPGEQVQVLPRRSPPKCLIWIVGKKTAPMEDFQIPQQGMWARRYSADA